MEPIEFFHNFLAKHLLLCLRFGIIMMDDFAIGNAGNIAFFPKERDENDHNKDAIQNELFWRRNGYAGVLSGARGCVTA